MPPLSNLFSNPDDEKETWGMTFPPKLLRGGYGGFPGSIRRDGPTFNSTPGFTAGQDAVGMAPMFGAFANQGNTGSYSSPQALRGAFPGLVPNQGPTGNSMQRQQQEAQGGISPQRRFFWATGRIDARAPQAQIPQYKSQLGELNKTMDSRPSVTWAERQAQNQQKITAAREMRGLSPY